ncbi:MAG: GNAT family N-acetyltransferase [Candidatus Cloacimonetes bacterium]|nr:GNAT family N-acetyltransferase [Candidatus Cloacimonadota bacterium]
MSITHHQYCPEDFSRVSDFLIAHYLTENRDGNWLQPAWEYMHTHPYLDEDSLDKIRIWQENGEIVAVVHYESRLGEVFFQIHPDYTALKPEMLEYAERSLKGSTKEGKSYLHVFENDFDDALNSLVTSKGYMRINAEDRPLSMLSIPDPFPEITVPKGFVIKSLADDNDLYKINRVLWRGFNHPGEPPEEDEDIEERKKMQSGPNFRKELTIVVEAPSGDFVSFAGTWFVPQKKYVYVEPVATDPNFRRMGLGRAALLESIRRCKELGAEVAYVGSGQKFYQKLGFKKIFTSQCWEKVW